MATSQNQNLTDRVDKLERHNGRLRIVNYVLLAALLSIATMGANEFNVARKVIDAEKFILRDENGNIRGGFAVDPKNGSSTMVLADKNGKVRAELIVGPDGKAGLTLADTSGKARLTVGLREDGSPDIGLADKNGTPRIGIGVVGSGLPAMVLYDDEKKPIWRALQ